MYLSHGRLRPESVEERDYQRILAERAAEAPHLLVLPTGLGKTVIALRAMLRRLEEEPDRRILFLAPTKPLCDQHAQFLRGALLDVAVEVFTGETPPTVRDEAWRKSRIIVATPQVVQNDLVRGARDLGDLSFVVYDEAHRATGQYPYGFIARRYRAAGGRHALGLTASPGNDAAALQKVLHNLHLERVEVRTDRDPDVAPYVKEVETEWVRVRPTLTAVQLVKLLERMYARCILSLRRLGYFPNLRGLPSRKDLLFLGQRQRADLRDGGPGRAPYEALSLQARALKLQHALELAETQGSTPACAFLRRLEEEAGTMGGSRAARDLVKEPEFSMALQLAGQDPEPSPKRARIVELVRSGLAAGHRRILIFANFRETADAIVATLATLPEVRASRFVGHARSAGEPGLTKRQQQDIVDRFRNGDLNVLVATAVGEEGLDLPETDAVILHEPVPSAIRFVQRRGRTGRRQEGKMYVLLTEGTRDEVYHWSALRRERKMMGTLASLKRLQPVPTHRPAAPATPAAPPARPTPPAAALPRVSASLEITMDPRESSSPVARTLLERGVRMRTSTLPTGDFAIGDRILVERKSAADFVASLKDGRLFDQLPRLGQAGVGILLVEGDPFGAAGSILPAALSGALAAACVDHRVSVVTVPGWEAATDFLVSVARRSHKEGTRPALRVAKAPRGPDEQLRYLVEGLPHVGPVLAQNLLHQFGSLLHLAEASAEELAQTPGIGDETARSLHELLRREYRAPHSAAVGRQVQVPVATLEGGDAAAR